MARKFTFRFEAILQLRKQVEQLSKQRFLRAQAVEAAASAAVERLAALLWKADRRVRGSLVRVGSLGMDGRQMVPGLRAHALGRHERDMLRLETARCRAQLLLDMKSRKVLGRFKGRAAAAHQFKEALAAVRESDDLHAMFSSANRTADMAAKDGRRALPQSTIESLT